MAGVRNAAIQLRYATAALSRKILNLVRKKKLYSTFVYQRFFPIPDWHTYMYVEKIGTKKGRRYDVDVNANKKPVFIPTSGFVTAKKVSRTNLPGVKVARVAKFTFGQRLFWHSSVIGRDTNRCDISTYSVFVTNCTSWTIAATLLAITISKIPI